jgi:sarcosine oxidase/L-pipecolate oxidase
VTSLLVESSIVAGVKTQAGETIHGDHFILATGAWTPHLADMSQVSVSNAQPVAFLQLTPLEAKTMSNNPVIIDLSTGWFAFPPTPGTNILKMARHGYGYEVAQAKAQSREASAPALSKDNAASSFLPDDAEKALRDGLASFYPFLKDRPFMRRRLCWYTDTHKGDFIVDNHFSYSNLFMATGGSGQ